MNRNPLLVAYESSLMGDPDVPVPEADSGIFARFKQAGRKILGQTSAKDVVVLKKDWPRNHWLVVRKGVKETDLFSLDSGDFCSLSNSTAVEEISALEVEFA